MQLDLSTARREFLARGVVILPQALDASLCDELAQRALALPAASRSELDTDASAHGVSGGRIRHGLFDGYAVARHLPELRGAYLGLCPLLAAVTGEDLIPGGFEESDVNVLVYDEQSLKEAHHDTVPVTLVVPLTTHPKGHGVLHLVDLAGHEHRYTSTAGDLVVFRGRQVLHWLDAATLDAPRVSVNANYYTPDDHGRAPGIDGALYGAGAR